MATFRIFISGFLAICVGGGIVISNAIWGWKHDDSLIGHLYPYMTYCLIPGGFILALVGFTFSDLDWRGEQALQTMGKGCLLTLIAIPLTWGAVLLQIKTGASGVMVIGGIPIVFPLIPGIAGLIGIGMFLEGLIRLIAELREHAISLSLVRHRRRINKRNKKLKSLREMASLKPMEIEKFNNRTLERLINRLIIALKNNEFVGTVGFNIASTALIKIGKPAVEPLVSLIEDKDENVRVRAIEILGKIHDEKAIEALLNVLKGKSRNLRIASAESFKYIRDERAVVPLIDVLNDFYVEGAIEALGNSGDERAIEPLIFYLKRMSNNDKLKKIIKGLRNIGRNKVIKPLIKELGTNKNAKVDLEKENVMYALGELFGPRNSYSISRWLYWYKNH